MGGIDRNRGNHRSRFDEIEDRVAALEEELAAARAGAFVVETNANYICPECTGAFDSWDGTINHKQCPWCGLKKGEAARE